MDDIPPREPHYMIDVALGTYAAFVVIQCTRCLWEAEVEAPIPAHTVNFRIEEHEQRCSPG